MNKTKKKKEKFKVKLEVIHEKREETHKAIVSGWSLLGSWLRSNNTQYLFNSYIDDVAETHSNLPRIGAKYVAQELKREYETNSQNKRETVHFYSDSLLGKDTISIRNKLRILAMLAVFGASMS